MAPATSRSTSSVIRPTPAKSAIWRILPGQEEGEQCRAKRSNVALPAHQIQDDRRAAHAGAPAHHATHESRRQSQSSHCPHSVPNWAEIQRQRRELSPFQRPAPEAHRCPATEGWLHPAESPRTTPPPTRMTSTAAHGAHDSTSSGSSATVLSTTLVATAGLTSHATARSGVITSANPNPVTA